MRPLSAFEREAARRPEREWMSIADADLSCLPSKDLYYSFHVASLFDM
jgi:hypothetical protein